MCALGVCSYQFRDKRLLRVACHHTSCGAVNWKKLALLGEVALSFAVTDYCVDHYGKESPCALTQACHCSCTHPGSPTPLAYLKATTWSASCLKPQS